MLKIFSLLIAFVLLSSFSQASRRNISSPYLSSVKPVLNNAGIGTLTRENFDDSLATLYGAMSLERAGLSFDVFRYGMLGYYSLENAGKVGDKRLITILDFSKPSSAKRLFTIDLSARKLKYNTLVAHGNKTGDNYAKNFSNRPHSNQSSLGFYVTGETYYGSKGYSLRLDGQELNYNSNIRKRAVVVHAADYVSEAWIKRYGRIGRSQGCPALPTDVSKSIIDTIKDRTVMFAYYGDDQYLQTSALLDFETMITGLEARQALAIK